MPTAAKHTARERVKEREDGARVREKGTSGNTTHHKYYLERVQEREDCRRVRVKETSDNTTHHKYCHTAVHSSL